MKRIASIFILAVLLFSCEKTISEFQSQNFIKFFGSGFESKGNDVIELADGSYVLTGYDQVTKEENQVFIVKVDENGNEIWSYAYGSDDNQEEGKVVKEVSDGFIIAGTSVNEDEAITHSFILKIGTNGDSLWYKEFGDPTLSVVVNDMVLNDEVIYVAGYYEVGLDQSNYYYMMLDDQGKESWGDILKGPEKGFSTVRKVFLQGGLPLLVTYNGDDEGIYIIKLNSEGEVTKSPDISTLNETVCDALFIDDQLYILTKNDDDGEVASFAKIYKVTAGAEEIWKTEEISSLEGKSLAYTEDGTLIVMAETNLLINAIEVDGSGTPSYGDGTFRTIAGSIEKVISTRDKGIILIGSTNATYGTRMQLIKTDKDLFLFRP
ncbi:MAG: hypothetical protein PF450_13080 [Bacteroidales bacterium]|jgi:hypothetical protein|nr:hypothetical protein [Bacteroidales bacterium]